MNLKNIKEYQESQHIDLKEIWERVNSLTNVYYEEIEAIIDIVKDIKGVIVEIGTRMGGSAIAMSMASGQKVYTIDDFSAPNINFEATKETIKDYDIELINKKSDEIDWDKEIDFLLIDGDHNYEPSKKDIEKWLPRVKKGGYILFHDYKSWTGITKAVDEAIENNLFTPINQVKTLLITRK